MHDLPRAGHGVVRGPRIAPPPAESATQDSAATRPTILAVGRLVEKKGFDQLIEACAQLRDQGLDFECLIVGESGSASDRPSASSSRRAALPIVYACTARSRKTRCASSMPARRCSLCLAR